MGCSENSMNLGFGLERDDMVVKRKYHWLFKISGISCQDSAVSKALPARRGARPGLSWKQHEFQHLNESIHYPFKPDWKPVQLHLYDLQCNNNPVFNWIKSAPDSFNSGMYNPRLGFWNPIISSEIKRTGTLIMLDGCKNAVETWIFEGCYPENIEWGDLEMDLSDVVTVDITLRYDRAYIDSGNESNLQTSSQLQLETAVSVPQRSPITPSPIQRSALTPILRSSR